MSKKKNNDLVLNELRRMTKLLALVVTKGRPQVEKMKLLADVGFKPKEIAEIVGSDSNHVKLALSKTNSKTAKKKKEESKAETAVNA